MRKFILMMIVVLLSFSTVSHATILENLPPKLRIYAGGKLGYNQQFISDGYFKNTAEAYTPFSNDAPSMSLGIVGGIRYEIIPRLFVRGELEYMYRIPANFDAADMGVLNAEVETQLHTILINAYIEYYVIPKVSIYATLGIGAAITDARVYHVPEIRKLGHESSFAIQVGLGAGYNITEHVVLDLTFRYLDVMSYSSTRAKFPLSAIELLAGVRYIF